ncbi:hypothetical protein NBO_1451g0002 [Nosema bombycis CQ1]|uniref:Uncharacterized protein n=1 Tax=Nosema bombycis (strain CQ1 / CVCC 102059) TaxID=578461 RepID=R0KM22_NOSB1|nr:hypothetical protein NBO_1451g0002 [Nosema bombycis CQ1]|eukprot:EOB11202.1 hypothetical protein NBO_1451g0002 [Nosema bombycis CQ1]
MKLTTNLFYKSLKDTYSDIDEEDVRDAMNDLISKANIVNFSEFVRFYNTAILLTSINSTRKTFMLDFIIDNSNTRKLGNYWAIPDKLIGFVLIIHPIFSLRRVLTA